MQVSQRADKAAERAAQQLEKLKAEGDGAKAAGRLEAHVAQQRAYAERLNGIAKRLDTAEAFDPQATLLEVRKGVDALIEQVSQKSLARGEKQARLKERMDALDPAKIDEHVKELEQHKADLAREFYDRWEIKRGGQGVDHANVTKPNFGEAAKDIANQVFDHLTGARTEASSHPDFFVPITRGPMKDRTFQIPDAKVATWLESNVHIAGERYARIMAGEVELTRRFGRADMRDQLSAIHDAYTTLHEKVSAAKTAEEARALVGQHAGAGDSFAAWMRGQGLDGATKERVHNWLTHDEAGAKTDLEGLRDLRRGTYKQNLQSGNLAKLSRSLRAFNYVRMMGNFIPANFTELYRPAMVHGLSAFMGDGIRPLIGNLARLFSEHETAFSRSAEETRLAGLATERILHGRVAAFADMGDPYAHGTALDRLLHKASSVASKWNGMAAFTDFEHHLASIVTQNRILKGVSAGNDVRFMAQLGVDPHMAERIAKQFSDHGELVDKCRVANTEKWTDDAAVRAFRFALAKDVETVIPLKGSGDAPLLSNNPLGSLLLQFRTFNLASHQRVMLRGMQESPANFASGLVAMTSMGMLAAYFTALRGGRERVDKFLKDAHDSPGKWIAEGLDKSSLFAIPFEVANTAETLTGAMGPGFRFNPIKDPIQRAGKQGSGSVESSSGLSRDTLASLLGPSGSLIDSLARAAGGGINAATGAPVSRQQRKAAAGLVPFSNYFGMREIVQAVQGDSPYAGR
jgi:hypothetical protein